MISHAARTQLSEGSDLAEYDAVLVGRRIVAAEVGHVTIPRSDGYRYPATAEGTLTLVDGTVLYVTPNDGGCSCGAGDYDLAHLASVDNIITAVRLVDESTGDDDSSYDNESGTYKTGHYSVYVVADAQEVNVLRVEGDDGNGYYGTGYTLTVVKS